MAGAYCRYCDRRCFVLRVLANGESFHLATCAAGMEHDRRVAGQDHTTALNPITQPDAVAALRTQLNQEGGHPMSGGSYNYLCNAEPADLLGRYADIQDMHDALAARGWHDAAAETFLLLPGSGGPVDAIEWHAGRLNALWQAVEWVDSADWTKEQAEAAYEAYCVQTPDPLPHLPRESAELERTRLHTALQAARQEIARMAAEMRELAVLRPAYEAAQASLAAIEERAAENERLRAALLAAAAPEEGRDWPDLTLKFFVVPSSKFEVGTGLQAPGVPTVQVFDGRASCVFTSEDYAALTRTQIQARLDAQQSLPSSIRTAMAAGFL